MNNKEISRLRKNINARVVNIFKNELTPVTAKTEADIFSNILYSRGTSREGMIMTYDEALSLSIKRAEKGEFVTPLTREDYNELVEELAETYKERLSVQGAVNEAYNLGMRRLNTFFEINSDDSLLNLVLEKVEKMSKRAVIDMLTDIGPKVNRAEKNGFSSDEAFYQLLLDYLNIDEDNI